MDIFNTIRKRYLHLLVISVLILAAYANSLNVPFQYDDFQNIVNSQYVKEPAYLFDLSTPQEFGMQNRTRYVSLLSFALNYALHGPTPLGFHVVNAVIHIANAVMVYFLVLLIFRTPALGGSRIRGVSDMAAFLASLVFALHPVQTQAVVYIVQRMASMAAMFYLAAVISYMKYRLGGGWRWYAAALFSTVLGMFTKENFITLPVMLLLLEIVFFKGRTGRRALDLLPFMLTLFIIPLVILLDSTGGDFSGIFEAADKGTKLLTGTGRAEYLYTQFGVMLKYLRLMVLPYGQNLDHYYPVEKSFLSPRVIGPLAVHVFIAASSVFVYIKSARGRIDPAFKAAAFGVLWFYLASSVESGLIPIMDVIYEHRVYLPGIGLMVSASLLAALLLNRYTVEKAVMGLAALCLAAVIVYLPLTVMRNTVWLSPLSLWGDAAHKAPSNPRARHNYGNALLKSGRFKDAIREFEAAVSLRPSQTVSYTGLSEAYEALGNAEMSRKYAEISGYVSSAPVDYYLERGKRYLSKGMLDRALAEYLKALDEASDNGAVLFNLGLVYYRKGMQDKAISYLARARSFDPGYADTYRLIGEIYIKRGRPGQAREAFQAGIAAVPLDSDLHSRAGMLAGERGDMAEAGRLFARAIELDDGNVQAYMGLGNVMLVSDDAEAAVKSLKKAVELAPGNAQAHYNLSRAYAALGRDEEAGQQIEAYRKLSGSR